MPIAARPSPLVSTSAIGRWFGVCHRIGGVGGRRKESSEPMLRPGEYIRDLFQKPVGTTVEARGWVKTRRDSKGVHFVQLNDGSSFQDLQVVIETGSIPQEVLAGVTTGASLKVTGDLVESPAAGQAVELKAREIHVYGGADPGTYPLQKKGHTMEFLREIAHLRPRSNTFGAVTRVRNALSFAV